MSLELKEFTANEAAVQLSSSHAVLVGKSESDVQV
jgi:hypothetical protein